MTVETPEWRLAPVYDMLHVIGAHLRQPAEALDDNNPRLAMQQCQKLQKKYSGSLILKALYALSLQRLGRIEEAQEAVDEVLFAQPSDQYVLQTAMFVYKGLGQLEKVVQLYENACKQRPQDEELANHHFMALVRVHDYKAMQQLANKLSKQFGQKRYFFWSACAIYMQARNTSGAADAATSKAMLLSLAERMLAKAYQDGKVTTYEQLLLYLDILSEQQKWRECLQIVYKDQERPEAERLIKVKEEFLRLKIEYADKCEDWSAVVQHASEVLEEKYGHFPHATSKALIRASKHAPAQTGDIFQEILAKHQSVLRGPQLAALEALGDDSGSQLVAKAVRYVEIIGKRECCFDDLRPYLSKLPAECLAELLKRTRQICCQSQESGNIKHESDFAKLAVWRKIQRFATSELPAADAEERISKLVQGYRQSVQNNPSGTRVILYRAIDLLEEGRRHSLSNFQFSLLLIRLYLIIGAVQQAMKVFIKLDVKNIQMDTLNYCLVEHFVDLGQYAVSASFSADAYSIYTANKRDTPEMLIMAFQEGTLSKVDEFSRFHRRLDNSISKRVIEQEIWRAEIFSGDNPWTRKHGQDNRQLTDDGYLAQLRDNRDVKVIADWSPSDADRLEHAVRPAPLRTTQHIRLLAHVQHVAGCCKTASADELGSAVEALRAFLEQAGGGDKRLASIEELAKLYVVLGRGRIAALSKESETESVEQLQQLLAAQLAAVKDIETGELSYEAISKCSSAVEVLAHVSQFSSAGNGGQQLKSVLSEHMSAVGAELKRLEGLVGDAQIQAMTQQLASLSTSDGQRNAASSAWIDKVVAGWQETVKGMSAEVERMQKNAVPSSGKGPTSLSLVSQTLAQNKPDFSTLDVARSCDGADKCVMLVKDPQGSTATMIVDAPPNAKYLGVAVGTGVNNADMYIAFKNSQGKWVFVNRRGTSQGIVPHPKVSTAFGSMSPVAVNTKTNRIPLSVRRPLATPSSEFAGIITNGPIPMLVFWSTDANSVKGDGTDATFSAPEQVGSTKVNLADQQQVQAGRNFLIAASGGTPAAAATTTTDASAATTTDSSAAAPTDAGNTAPVGNGTSGDSPATLPTTTQPASNSATAQAAVVPLATILMAAALALF
ncbi:mitochondrial distribution and morphology [Sorochytrium milnesiophthora]